MIILSILLHNMRIKNNRKGALNCAPLFYFGQG
nr:MAG TPA: hypothetical protein [Caudoviricetes sp.]